MIRFLELRKGDVVYAIIFDGVSGSYEVAEMVFGGLESAIVDDFEPKALVRRQNTGESFRLSNESSLYCTREEAEMAAVAFMLNPLGPLSDV